MALILTQEPVRVEEEEAAQQILGHLSLPQEPDKPAETKEVTPPIESHPDIAQPEREVLPKTSTPERTIMTVPEAAPIPPSRDQLLRESIENDYKKVLQWQRWHTSPLQTFIETFEAMKDEEEFALEWIDTKDVYEALRLETIRRVYSYKIQEEEENDKNSNPGDHTDPDDDPENQEDDEAEDDKFDDAQDDSHGDDGDDDDDEGKDNNQNDDSDDDDDDEGNSGYDSESPIIGNTEDLPEKPPASRQSPPKEDPTHLLPLAMLPPHQEKARDGNRDASSSDDSGEESPQISEHSPRHIMEQVLNALFNAEVIHMQYLDQRQKKTENT
ncbi:PREDICTED: nuclear polyadenylated RNA-binding protein 3-like [Ipomoea nil]|uniref:nuclear polyadenylated RNA-binding protein 3-like n=1 Tax=Ipomoea nil TaxID=35883 RepID=UPI000901FCBD|nr:PREDICTED: nuclear polyadenylated RNA-binding protein 3-like [Ipomoea nil]